MPSKESDYSFEGILFIYSQYNETYYRCVFIIKI